MLHEKEVFTLIAKIQGAFRNPSLSGWEMSFLDKIESRLLDGKKTPQVSEKERYRLNQIFAKQ